MQWQRRLSELVQHAVFARMADAIARRLQRVDDLGYRLLDAYRRRIESNRRQLEDTNTRLRHFDLRLVLADMRRQLEAHKSSLQAMAQRLLLQRRGRLERSAVRLQELSPLKILDRGYALVYDAKGKLVKDENQVSPGDNISARLARGTIAAVVRRK
jgi:exodeoxyribonuclease VII large subunit